MVGRDLKEIAGAPVRKTGNGARRRVWAEWLIKPAILTSLGLVLVVSARTVAKHGSKNVGDGFAPRSAPIPPQASNSDVAVREAVRFSLLYFVPPIWLAAALADWLCHRRSRIEETAGVKESLIHILMQAEMGAPILATVFLEITSPVILLGIAAFLIHEGTVHWDLRVAASRREITPTEQIVHSFMEMMPLVGLWLVSMLREDELRALIGISARSPDFSLRLKGDPLPATYRTALLGAIALIGGVPYVEELSRTARAALRSA